MSRLIKLRILARRLRLPIGWLHREAESGRIPSLKVMHGYYFDAEAVEKVLTDRAKSSAKESANE